MKPLNAILLLLLLSFAASGQKPKSGTYKYKIAFAEWNGRSLGATCTVIIKGDSVKVIDNGSLNVKKGDLLDRGILMKHKRTGKWIIAHDPKDIYSKEVGGCTDGPNEIDFVRKLFWMC